MGFFTNTQAALAAGSTVFFAELIAFDFAEGIERTWPRGFGDLVAGGQTWRGTGDVLSMSDVPVGLNDFAGSMSFTLSGVSPAIVAAAKNSASVRGRAVTIHGQFLDDALAPLDGLVAFGEFAMDVMTFAGRGPSERIVSVTAETIWTNRNAASFATFSHADQQHRSPGDRGLERVSLLTGTRRVWWPRFEGSGGLADPGGEAGGGF